MKRIILILLGCILAFPLFGSDLFFEETSSRTFSFEPEIAYGIFRDGRYLQQADLRFSLEQNDEHYQAKAQLDYDHQRQSLEASELSISLFLGASVVKAGLFTHAWGSAVSAHVVDILQGRDLRRGFLDDLEAMKRPSYLALFSTYWERSSFEFVFKPGFIPSYLVTEGRYALIPDAFKNAAITEMDTLDWRAWETGARYRTSLGMLDLGLIYSNTHQYDAGFTNLVIDSSTFAVTSLELVYTRYQLFGMEANLPFGAYSLALEGGFFLSEDKDGTDSGLYNSKWASLIELSYTHPQTSAFVGLTYQGTYVLDFPTSPLDVDSIASFDGKAYANTFILVLEYPLMQQRLTGRAALTYQVECEGYALLFSLSYALQDSLILTAKATMYGALGTKDSLYKSWDENDGVQIGIKAWF